MQNIIDQLQEHQKVVEDVFINLQSYIYTAKIVVQEAMKQNNKIFIFGNGIHAHSACTLAYQLNSIKPSSAFSLTSDVGVITDIGNTYGIDKIFEKQIATMASSGDVLLGLSTSGCSKNILRALSLGRNIGCKTIGISGNDGGAMGEFCDVNIIIPSDDMARIQEMYSMILSIVQR